MHISKKTHYASERELLQALLDFGLARDSKQRMQAKGTPPFIFWLLLTSEELRDNKEKDHERASFSEFYPIPLLNYLIFS